MLGSCRLHEGLRNLPKFISHMSFCVGFRVKFVLSQGQTVGGPTLVNSGLEIAALPTLSLGQPSEST